jgi:hypothetical protein
MRVSAALAAVCALVSIADAEQEPTVFGALPSGIHVARARTLDQGVAAVEVMSGLGFRRGLLGADHRLVRALGTVAAAFGVTSELSLGLSFDGYYDRHRGFPTGTTSGCGDRCEEGYVGAPRLNARYARRVGGATVGVHAMVWVPGDQMPSIKLSATSLELRGLASIAAGPGRLSIDAGFRLDNTDKTVDDIAAFTVPDRVSYGSSNYNAVVAGLHYALPVTPRLWIAAETSIARFVGAPPSGMADLEDGRVLARAGGSLGFAVASQWTVVAFVDAVKSPRVLDSQAMASNIPLIPYEPTVVAGLGLHAQFGGGSPRESSATIVKAPPCWDTPQGCAAEEQPLVSDIAGTVVDDAGKPLAGATVTITGKKTGVTAAAKTNDDGSYVLTGVRIGRRTVTPGKAGPTTADAVEETELEVRIVAEGRDPVVSTIAAPKPGANPAPPVTLQPTLPPGQVKGFVRSQRGKPIANAEVIATPGDAKTVSAADGTFTIDLAPGTYKVTVRAAGYAAQVLNVTIDPNGVALKEFILGR